MEADAGLYTFYTNNWDVVEAIAMQITILSSPALTGTSTINTFEIVIILVEYNS